MGTSGSPNFGFLAGLDPHLLEIAASAENAFSKDPNWTLVKLRQLAEYLVRTLAAQVGITPSRETKLAELIPAVALRIQMDVRVVRWLHHLRVKGNEAAHDYRQQSYGEAVDALRSARELCVWHYRAFGNPGSDFKPGPFIKPRDWNSEERTLKVEIDRLKSLLDKERESSAVSRTLVESLKQEEERARRLLEERTRDADASFALAEEQSREVDRLRATLEERLRETAALSQSKQVDFEAITVRAHEAARHTSAEWTPQIALADAFLDDELTADQAKLVAELQAFLEDSTARVFLMNGYAGTGKTFITKGLSNFLASTGRRCELAAPTGKAARVLTQKSGRIATTIHKKIYSTNDVKEYKVDGLDGSETYKFYAELRVNEDADSTVYIVDEASMVSDVYSEGEFFRFGSGKLLTDLFKYINLDHNDHDKKVIFIGDPAQLPPVGMNFSPALDPRYLSRTFGVHKPPSYELTQVVRHESDSGILRSASEVRKSIKQAVFNRLGFDESMDVHLLRDHEELISAYLAASEQKVSDKAMIIAWSNADVASLNELVRSRLLPNQPAACAGDKLVVTTNCVLDGVALNNGDLVYITEVGPESEIRTVRLKSKNPDTGAVAEVEIRLAFRDMRLGYRDPSGTACYTRVKILENLLYNDQPNLSSDENKALYIDFMIRNPGLPKRGKLLRDALRADLYFNALRVKFGYALTCHKAQGSEWESAFVSCRMGGASLSSEAYFRWIYTAITRAKGRLHLLGAPRFTPWSEIEEPTASPPEPKRPLTTGGFEAGAQPLEARPDEPVELIHQEDDLVGRLDAAIVELLGISEEFKVDGIDHHAYQVAVHVSDGTGSARVNISYNGRGVVGSVIPIPRTDFGVAIAARLAPLLGRRFLNDSGPDPQGTFARDVFNEFYPAFLAAAKAEGLEVLGVVEEPWNLRITLSNAKVQAQVAIYSDGKGRIKRWSWVGKPPSDHSLVEAFGRALKSI